MKFIILILMQIILGCSHPTKKNENISFFESQSSIMIGQNKKNITLKMGEPASTQVYEINGAGFTEMIYKSTNGEELQILTNNKNETVAEKIYFPKKNSELSSLEFITEKRYSGYNLKEFKSKCPHSGGSIYIDQVKGILIATDKQETSEVIAISEANQEVLGFRINGIENQKCRY